MRQIHLVANEIARCHILFDGLVKTGHRHEYSTLDVLLDAIPGCIEKYNVKKPIEVYFEGYTPEQVKSLTLVLDTKLPKAKYINGSESSH
jgi:hypothetical protein